ncbi:MFS transporter [Pandoraea norimbergensis]|uniref:MFS transporter n=1 Tax=Pandoraea norimbergensis TaxID=93219 RepID=A0ABN4JDB5_9BURK|nr:MFS transporter [Pandoraea norimbergensis]ALS58906.1 MFS transporter [Pandoraea norimbergensis]
MSIATSQPWPPADASLRRRLLGLFSVCLAALLLPMSFSGGAVATPAIGAALHGSALEMRWITSAFMLAFGGCLMAAGACADAFGRKRIFLLGVGCLLLTSLALAMSHSALAVDWLRALQGVAAAATLAGGGASLAQDFDGHARARAYGLLGTTFGVGLAFGPLLAGVLIARFGWRGVFAATAVIAAFALCIGARCMRESRDPAAAGLDWPGTLTFTGALACFTYGVIQAPAIGATAPEVIGSLVFALVLTIAFVVIERRVAHPMLDLTLFRYVRFIGVQMLPIATCCCYIVLLVLLPLRFIGVHGDSEIVAGMRMMAMSLPMLVVPFVATQLARRMPAGVLCSSGLVLAAVGLVWLARTAGAPSTLHSGVLNPALWPMLLIGAGSAVPWGLMDGLSVSVVPTERAGMAMGIFNTTRVASEGVALALVGAVLIALIGTHLPDLHGAVAPDVAREAVNRLVAGDMRGAVASVPAWGEAALRDAYEQAFATLLDRLAIVTLLCAAVVFACLGGKPRTGASDLGEPSTDIGTR